MHRTDFNDVKKKSKIYTKDWKSFYEDIVKEAKNSPGIGKYNVTEYDEKKCKPPRGLFKVKSEKFTVSEEIMFAAKGKPGFYPEVNQNLIKRRPY